MKRKINLKERFQLALNAFKITKNVVIAQCNICNSVDIEFKTILDTKVHYSSEYVCKKCGATCKQYEYWNESYK